MERIFIDLTHSSSDEGEEATKPIVIEDSEEEEAPRITVDEVVRKILEDGSYAHFRKQFPEDKYR